MAIFKARLLFKTDSAEGSDGDNKVTVIVIIIIVKRYSETNSE